MKVELLYFNGCPNYKVLLLRLRGFLQREGIEAELELKRVETPEEAVRLGFIGSPRVRVDGHDIESRPPSVVTSASSAVSTGPPMASRACPPTACCSPRSAPSGEG